MMEEAVNVQEKYSQFVQGEYQCVDYVKFKLDYLSEKEDENFLTWQIV